MPKPIDINDAFIKTQFRNFVDFAQGKADGTKVRVLIGNEEHAIGAKSECFLNKIFFRAPSNKAVNNEVRTLFRQSVAQMFGGEEHMPPSVRTAMRLGDYGKGRPLTARRIRAVQSALAQIAAKHDALLEKGLNEYGDRANGLAADRIKLAFSSCHGNADAMDIVDKHLGTIIESGEGDLRGEQAVKDRVEGMVGNLEQLKTLSRRNPAIYEAGKQMLMFVGKPVPRDILAGLVRAANRAPLNLLRRLDEGSTGLDIHKTLRQFYDTILAAMESTGAGKKYAAEPDAKTALRAFAGTIILSRCSADALRNIRDALTSPTNAHLCRLYSRYQEGETDGVPEDTPDETVEGLRDAGEIAENFMEMLTYCVRENLLRLGTPPNDAKVKIGECNGIPDLPALGGEALVNEVLSLARTVNALNVEDYVNGTVKGQGRAADEARQLVRNKLGETNDPARKLTGRLGANASAMMNITLCGEMKKLAAGQVSQFQQDIHRGINATLRDGNKTIKLSNDFATARDELARFVTGDDGARYATLQPAARNKVHLLMALLSQETEKAGENGVQYALHPRESQTAFTISTPGLGTGRKERTFNVQKTDDGGISLQYVMNKQLNRYTTLPGGEDHSLAPASNFICLLGYGLKGDEFDRVAGLDYSGYDDERISSVIDETGELENGKVGCKPNALFRAVEAMPEQFQIVAECTLDFTLDLVPEANA